MGTITNLTDATFDETVRSADKPILVDFWAEWCGPCKQIAPILSEIATEQAGKITIAKLNVDDYGDIAGRFNVMSIPTLLVFHKGEVRKRLVGAKGKGQLLDDLAVARLSQPATLPGGLSRRRFLQVAGAGAGAAAGKYRPGLRLVAASIRAAAFCRSAISSRRRARSDCKRRM